MYAQSCLFVVISWRRDKLGCLWFRRFGFFDFGLGWRLGRFFAVPITEFALKVIDFAAQFPIRATKIAGNFWQSPAEQHQGDDADENHLGITQAGKHGSNPSKSFSIDHRLPSVIRFGADELTEQANMRSDTGLRRQRSWSPHAAEDC